MNIYRGTNPFKIAQEPEPSEPILDVYVRHDYCDATKKNGEPCRQKTLYRGGRCKFHGGLSTGPRTEEGKQQSRINGAKGGRPRKAQVSEVRDESEIAEKETAPKAGRQTPQTIGSPDDLTRKLEELMRKVESLRR